jgi:hypothetical protein
MYILLLLGLIAPPAPAPFCYMPWSAHGAAVEPGSVGYARALLRETDVVVLAAAVSESPDAGKASPGIHTRVRFRVLEVLEGELADSVLRIPGRLVEEDDLNPGTVPYTSARNDAQAGSCYAYNYRRGATFLLLLKETRDGLTPYWAPLAPVNEQVRGPDDPWVFWVRSYLATRRVW